MKLLLDTHTLLWYLQQSEKLPAQVSDLLEEPSYRLYLSIVSLWEISIKLNLGKLKLEISFSSLQTLLEQLRIEILPISFADTERYLYLPLHHRDPFDRMLITQAMNRSLDVVSCDEKFDLYPIQRVWA